MANWARSHEKRIPLLLLALAAGCSGAANRPSAPALPVASSPAPSTPKPPSPDFARLRAFRSYYGVERVEAYEHHFLVQFFDLEAAFRYYDVAPDGTVRSGGGGCCGPARAGGVFSPVPDEQRDNARRVEARLHADEPGASRVTVEYLGSYREVVIVEIMPLSGPGDPSTRSIRRATATLRASPDLTSFHGSAHMTLVTTRMCWEKDWVRICDGPHWIDFVPAEAPGRVHLAGLVTEGSPEPHAEQARFAAAALAAARDHEAGRPSASLSAMLAREPDRLLPERLSVPLQVTFEIWALPAGPDVGADMARIRIALPTAGVFRGGAHGAGTARIAGVEVRAEVDVRATAPVEGSGAVERDVELRYRLDDGRGNARTAEARLHARVMVDGSTIVAATFGWPPGSAVPMGAPRAQHLPGAGPYLALDASLELAARPDDW
jgi:hypothetical protein